MSNIVYTQGTGSSSTDVFVTRISEQNPSPSDINYPVGKRWVNSTTGGEFILVGQTSNNGQILANWIALGGTGGFTPPLSVSLGGTGNTTFSPYSVLCSGTASQLPFFSVSPGTIGQILTSQGNNSYPTWETVAAGTFSYAIEIITQDTPFIPSPNLTYVEVICVGGGGGGGGAGTNSVGGGGGGGGYASRIYRRDQIGDDPINVVIGQGGSGGSAGQTGSAGTASSFGIFITSSGGQGGQSTTGSGNFSVASGGTPGNSTTGDINLDGQNGFPGFIAGNGTTEGIGISGQGGSSFLGFGAPSVTINTVTGFSPGVESFSYGAGGSGAVAASQGQQSSGGRGGNGVVIINSYIL
jgi:hypothetical protein